MGLAIALPATEEQDMPAELSVAVRCKRSAAFCSLCGDLTQAGSSRGDPRQPAAGANAAGPHAYNPPVSLQL